ncbi:MAG: hypothetical protein D3922_03735 [Candidatus Electrothrix sp. AR1]|nr:hypothetical protein [Candidatus Electrothrix sp. AR1]
MSGASIALKLATLKMSELDDVKKSFELYEEKTGEFYEKWISNIDDLKEEFKKMVFEICGEKKLVIFIDDLDRCSPGNAVKLLEDIKHFLAINNSKCIFVIGVDKYALTTAINIKYGINSINTDEYLEKIINLSIAVPKVNSATYKKYIIETIKQQTTSGWYTTLTTDIELFANILSSVDCSNPRRTKMVINRYLLYLGMYDKKKLFTEIIIKLIICREFFPLAYRVREISNIVNYFPQTRKGNHNFEQRSYKEIEDDSNSDFARIYYTSELKELGPCPKNKSLTWLIINCFDKPRAKIAEVLAGQRKEEAEGIDLDAIDGWVSDKYVMKHHDYFEVVNFLFTLA